MSSAQDGGGTGLVPAEPSDADPVVSRRVRGLVIAVCTVLLAHLVATFLWAAPGYLVGRADGVATSEAQDTALHGVLEPYLTPTFAQSWSIFAPSPLHVEYTLRVRGVYADGPDGELAPGPWTDTTAVEVRALVGHLVPAATERPSRRLASETRDALLALPQDARSVALRPSGDVQGVGDPERARDVPWPALRTALLDAGGAPNAVDRYLGQDRALAAYATQVLRAEEAGTDGLAPVYVQASIVRRGVAPQGAKERPTPTTLTLGARPPESLPGQDDAAFRRAWQTLRSELPAGAGGAAGAGATGGAG